MRERVYVDAHPYRWGSRVTFGRSLRIILAAKGILSNVFAAMSERCLVANTMLEVVVLPAPTREPLSAILPRTDDGVVGGKRCKGANDRSYPLFRSVFLHHDGGLKVVGHHHEGVESEEGNAHPSWVRPYAPLPIIHQPYGV